jgi:hypothetical protein
MEKNYHKQEGSFVIENTKEEIITAAKIGIGFENLGEMKGGKDFVTPLINGIYRSKKTEKLCILVDIAKDENDKEIAIYKKLDKGFFGETKLLVDSLENFLFVNEYDGYLTSKYQKANNYKKAADIALEEAKKEETKQQKHYYGAIVAQNIQTRLLKNFRANINELEDKFIDESIEEDVKQ